MFTVRFVIVATVIATGERFECFRWTRDAASGIGAAKLRAQDFGMADKLTDFRAEAV